MHLAQAGVRALAGGEVEGISPLVIHGPAGVGKSTLLAALVAERLARRPEGAIADTSAEGFAAACAEAGNTPGGWAELRARFRGVDLLVVDDLHALERAPSAFDELAHTLDALDAAGAAVAVAARAGPGNWEGWPRRLVNRLMAGLSVRVDPPGLRSRRRYLLARARTLAITVEAAQVDRMAEDADGYRTVNGWLARLALERKIGRGRGRQEVDPHPIGRDDPDEATAGVDVDRIARAVAGHFGVSVRDLRGATRRRAVVEARHVAMHLARRHTPLSFAALGAAFGGRDAATARHACRAASGRIAADPALAAAVAAVASAWGARGTDGKALRGGGLGPPLSRAGALPRRGGPGTIEP